MSSAVWPREGNEKASLNPPRTYTNSQRTYNVCSFNARQNTDVGLFGKVEPSWVMTLFQYLCLYRTVAGKVSIFGEKYV